MSRFNGRQHNYEAVCTTESVWQLSPFHSYLPYLSIADMWAFQSNNHHPQIVAAQKQAVKKIVAAVSD